MAQGDFCEGGEPSIREDPMFSDLRPFPSFDQSLLEGISPALLDTIDPDLLGKAEYFGLQRASNFVRFLDGDSNQDGIYGVHVDCAKDPLSVVRHGAFCAVLGLPKLPDPTTPPTSKYQPTLTIPKPSGEIRRALFIPSHHLLVSRDYTNKPVSPTLMDVTYVAIRRATEQ